VTNTNTVRLTIGIPMFNDVNTVAEAINSLKAQTYHNWTCYVSDDSEGNETYTAAMLAIGNDARFTVIRNPERLGPAGNWNSLLEMSNTEYFKLLHADDVLNSSALKVQIAALDREPTAVLCTGRRNIISSSGRVILRNKGLHANNESIANRDVANKFIRSGSNFLGEPSFAMFRTASLKSVGGFSNEWSYLIDVATYLMVLRSGKCVHLSDNLGSFRISRGSWSSRLGKSQWKESCKCIDFALSESYSSATKFEGIIGKSRSLIASVIRRAIFRFLS
jgi:glycosyltransferase involved in cell wall biosynthesis